MVTVKKWFSKFFLVRKFQVSKWLDSLIEVMRVLLAHIWSTEPNSSFAVDPITIQNCSEGILVGTHCSVGTYLEYAGRVNLA